MKFPQFDPSEAARRLYTHYRAANNALDDLDRAEPIFIGFDHSLVAPWFFSLPPRREYTIVGYNIFRLYNLVGYNTPYRLIINYPTMREIQDQLAHCCDNLTQLSSLFSSTFTEQGLVRADPFSKNLEQFRKLFNREQINCENFSIFQSMVNDRQIRGTFDVFPYDSSFHIEMSQIREFKDILLSMRKYTQSDKDDREMHLEMDALRPLEIIQINEHFHGHPYMYSGGLSVSSLFGSDREYYCRRPLTILTSLYSFFQADETESLLTQARQWLKNKSEEIHKCMGILSMRENDYNKLNHHERLVVDSTELLYIIPMYQFENYSTFGVMDKEIMYKHLFEPRRVRRIAEESIENHRKLAEDFSNTVERAGERSLYERVEDRLSPETIKRIDQIVKSIKAHHS